MPPRIYCPAPRSLGLLAVSRQSSRSAAVILSSSTSTPRQYATASLAPRGMTPTDGFVPANQPPSARSPDTRKSQLLRTYTSLLRSSPLMLVFQHNNLTAQEWASVRRELRIGMKGAVATAPVQDGIQPSDADLASRINIQVIRTNMMDVAARIVELERITGASGAQEADTAPNGKGSKVYSHDLSKDVWNKVNKAMKDNTLAESRYAELSALFTGPIAIVAFPAVTPALLSSVLKVLAPCPPAFPAPSKKKNPSYYDAHAQSGFQKLMLVGGRIEDKVFDVEGVQWVGGIEGGIDSLRAQVVYLLQSAGMGLTNALEGASKSLWFTMENRKAMLQEEEKGPAEAKPEEKEDASS